MKPVVSTALLVAIIAFAMPASANQVYSFGDGANGETGLGEDVYITSIPTAIDTTYLAGKTIRQVESGSGFSLILDTEGTVYSFGQHYNGITGQGLTEGSTSVATPIDTSLLGDKVVTQVSAAPGHSLLLTKEGTVFSFGYRYLGRGGDGTVATPIDSTNLTGKTITAVAAGGGHGLLLSDEGTVFSFGRGNNGETGLGTDDNVEVPTPIDASHFLGKHIVQIAARFNHSLALASDGTVFAFGTNRYGQTGQGTDDFDTLFPTPVDDTNLEGKHIVQISAGHDFSLILADDGTVFSFGSNSDGKTGLGLDNSLTLIPTPIDMTNITSSRITAVSAGYEHSLLLGDDGLAYSFGSNVWGQTGLGIQEGATLIATQIDMSSLQVQRISQVSAGSLNSLLLTVPEPSSVIFAGLGIFVMTWRLSKSS